jgi:hypothetical protein
MTLGANIPIGVWNHILVLTLYKSEVKFTLEQAMKAQRERRSIALLFL